VEAVRAEVERVRADAVARVAERDVVFEAMVDGVFVCDRAGQARYMNGAYRRLLGLTVASETLVRSPEGRGYVFAARDVAGRPLSPQEWPMARVLRGEVMTGGQTLDLLVRTLDGREVALNASGAPVYDALGYVDGGVVIFREVTERRAVERRTHAALDALLAMARALVGGPEPAEAAEGTEETDDLASLRAVGYQLIELARNVLNCSHVGMIGVTPALDLRPLVQVGLSPAQEQQWRARIVGGELADNIAVYETLRARLAAGESLVFDTTRAPFDALSNPFGLRAYLVTPMCVGTTLVGLLTVAYGDDGAGDGRGVEQVYSEGVIALAGAVARLAALVIERERLLRERHEARATELALRAANARMEEFLSIAGHELRTPLTSILGNVQLMERWMDSARQIILPQEDEASAPLDRVRGLLDRVERQTRLIDRLVNDLLDASRVQAGQLSLRMEPHDLLLLTRDIVREQRQRVPRRVVRLDVPDQTSVWVRADGDRIAQVLTNYLTNALKYSAGDTPIVVGLDVDVDGMMARVWVRDEGPGLDLAEQERVWERFYRSADVEHRTGSSVGLGLGLYISRTIVERHGGRVGVESTPGAGAAFWFVLPTIAGSAS
jgi:signal transduction histidine kinase